MKVYTKPFYTDTIYCIKTKAPKFNGKLAYSWDALETKIDDVVLKFYFTVKNNSSYFYFILDNQWYKTDIISKSGFDLFHFISNISGEFSKEKKI